MIPAVFSAFRMPARRIGVLLLAGTVWTQASPGPVAADDNPAGRADPARELVDEVLAEPGGAALDAWSRAVTGRARERAVGTAAPPGFPRHAPPVEWRADTTAEVLVFTSLAVPAASWRAAARDAARIGAPLVLRGVAKGGLGGTARQVRARLGYADAGVAIDPRLFRLFGIERVPAVVIVPGGVPPCRQRGCAGDAPPPFDRVSGNLSLAAALEAVAAEGGAGRATAQRYLAILRGTER